jgi:hypothetical protein
MANVGISHPDVLDLVTQSDSEVRLVLVEERALSERDAVALQAKLNNYLAYALDGALVQQYPQCDGKRVYLRVDLYARPSEFIREFIARYREAVAQYNVGVELCVQGELAP